MKKPFLIFLFFVSVLFACAQGDTMLYLTASVGNDLPVWLKKIPIGKEAGYGFLNREEFARASLGVPIEVYILNDDFFSDNTSSVSLKPSGEWRIPIMVDNESRALITIIRHAGDWKIVDLGATVLAHEIGEMIKNSEGKTSGVLKFLRIYQIQSDFLFSDDPSFPAEKINLIPLHSALFSLEGLNLKSNETCNLSAVSSLIRKRLDSPNSDR